MRTEFFAAISAIAAERGIPRERIIEQVEKALAAAYRRSLGDRPPIMEVRVEIDSVKGDPHVYSELLVVDEVEDPRFEISIDDACKINPSIQLLDKIMVETTPRDFGRIAAQTAKQVILQGIRDVERDNVYVEFNERRGELMIGQVQRNVNGNIIIAQGKASVGNNILFSACQPTQRTRQRPIFKGSCLSSITPTNQVNPFLPANF